MTLWTFDLRGTREWKIGDRKANVDFPPRGHENPRVWCLSVTTTNRVLAHRHYLRAAEVQEQRRRTGDRSCVIYGPRAPGPASRTGPLPVGQSYPLLLPPPMRPWPSQTTFRF